MGGFWKTLHARWGSGAGETDDVRIDASTNSLQTVTYEHHEIHSGSSYYTEGHTTLGDGNPDPVNFYAAFTTPSGTKYSHMIWTVTSSGVTDISMYEGSSGGMANGTRGVIHANNRTKNCWWGIHDGGDAQAVLTDASQAWTPDALIDMHVYNQTAAACAFITDNTDDDVTGVISGGTAATWDDGDVYEINNSQMIVNVGIDVPTIYGLQIADTAFGGTGFKSDVGGGTTRANEIVVRPDTIYLMHIASGSENNIVTFSLHWYEHTDKN